jgi:hypothetical protein
MQQSCLYLIVAVDFRITGKSACVTRFKSFFLAKIAENNYRYKGRVTRDKEKKDDIRRFSFRGRAMVREDQYVA